MRTFVCLSGGLDSAVMLAAHKSRFPKREFVAVTFDYGSKHNRYEHCAFEAICTHYGIQERIYVNVPGAICKAWERSGSALMDRGPDIPEGHYHKDNMAQTVVPCRNLLFVAMIAAMGPDEILIGVHQGDHHIYPDCRPSFLAPLIETVLKGSDGKTRLVAPLICSDKASIVATGLSLGVPFELTRTCYKDQEHACGVCGSCQERLEAFHLNNATDPLYYESRTLLPKE